MDDSTRAQRTALYRMFDADDVLLYVGISYVVPARMEWHARYQPWWPQVARRIVEWYGNRDLAEAAEKAAIRAEKPRHNVTHAGGALPEPLIPLPPEVIAWLHRVAAELEGKSRTRHSMLLERFMRDHCLR